MDFSRYVFNTSGECIMWWYWSGSSHLTHMCKFPWRYCSPCTTSMRDIGCYCAPICRSGPSLSMTPAPPPVPAIRKSATCLFTVQLSLFYLAHHLHMLLANVSFGDMFPYLLLECRSCATINAVRLIRWCPYMGESLCWLPISIKVSFYLVFVMLMNVCGWACLCCYCHCYLYSTTPTISRVFILPLLTYSFTMVGLQWSWLWRICHGVHGPTLYQWRDAMFLSNWHAAIAREMPSWSAGWENPELPHYVPMTGLRQWHVVRFTFPLPPQSTWLSLCICTTIQLRCLHSTSNLVTM